MNNTHPHLSFDGFGINGRDKFRTRLATLRDSAEAQALGPVFAAAPDLLAALEEIAGCLNGHNFAEHNEIADVMRQVAAAAIALAKPPTP